MQVKDIMKKEIRFLSPDISAKDALREILKQRISGLPVMDEDKNLLGMFTEKDILRYILPEYIERVGEFVYTETPKSILNKLAALDTIKVKDIMRVRKEVITISPDASLGEAARLALTQKARRIIVEENGKAAGIIAREDLLRAFLKELR